MILIEISVILRYFIFYKICIYTGTHPEQRGMNADTLDPAYYVVAKAISGSTVTFTALGENDFLKLYNIPDNYPLRWTLCPPELPVP